ncbi:MAG: ABC transporter transmembrane domain-containing protein, partial [bacterium]
MKTYLRILTYLRGYWAHLLISIFCIFMFTVVSGITLISVMPFLQVIFYSGDLNSHQEYDTSLVNPTVLNNVQEMGQQFLPSLKDQRDKIKHWINKFFIGSNPKSALLRICLIIVTIFFLKGLFGYLQVYFMAQVEQGVVMDIRNELYSHISKLSLGYFNAHRSGHLISRITNDVNLINSGIAATFVTLIKNPLLILSFLAIALYLSWQLTIIALIILPFSVTLIGAVGLKLRKDSAVSQEKMGDVTCVLQETITGIRIVKAFGMEKFEWEKFRKQTKAYCNSLLKLIRVRGLASPLTEFLGALVGVGIIWIGGQKVLAGNALSPDEFITFLFVIFSIMNPVKELSTVNNRI